MSGNAQRAPRVARQIPPFAGELSGLEPEGAVEPERAHTCHMRASVPVDRRQPAGVPVRAASPGGLAYPLGETVLDNGPIDEWQPIEVGKIRRFHDGMTNPTTEIHRPCIKELSLRTPIRVTPAVAEGRKREQCRLGEERDPGDVRRGGGQHDDREREVGPDGSFHQVMYNLHMGGATPPPEPGAERLIVRMRPDKVYGPPLYQATPEDG